ncbi:hypothetical protein [Phytobacter sp. RSE-02]|uniref:hypothetical protein n=1 Tax=Phytobacter sp. RSE-02 TaxID=3229229 RepID=UPI00339D90B3
MKDGFYWIQFNGLVQIALLLTGGARDVERDQKARDYWLIDGGVEVEHGDNVKVVYGPLDIHV